MSDFDTQYSQICRLLDAFWSNETPRGIDFEVDNPTRDPLKFKLLRQDAIVDWRLKVYNAFRCNLQVANGCSQNAWFAGRHICMRYMCGHLYPHEQRYWRRYLSKGECWAWWAIYWNHTGADSVDLGRAVRKIHRNLERAKAYWE